MSDTRRPPAGLVLLLLGACSSAPAVPPEAPPTPDATTDSERDDGPPSPAVQAGLEKLQAGDAKGAVELLTKATDADPEDGNAWLLRGIAERNAGDGPAAVESLERAATIENTRPSALYQLAVTHGTAGDLDRAFEQLALAAKTGKVDVTGFAATPGLTELVDDPRFTALLPDAATLDDPFVEEVRVLKEWRGEAAGDQFGWIARNIGDVDGDGIADVVTSAPSNAEGGAGAGKVYVYSSATGELLWSRTGVAGEGLGMGVEAAGDVNADGVPDVIAGGPGQDRAHVFSGRDGGTTIELYGEEGSNFGRMVSDVGDVDRDGHADVLIGDPTAGEVVLRAGDFGNRLARLQLPEDGTRFGAAGDGTMDEEGRVLLAIGAPDAGPERRGRVLVYTGEYERIDDQPRFVLEAEDTGAELGGMFVSIVGDVDGDGTPDVYASDWSDGAKGPTTGRAYIWSGATGDRLHLFTGEAKGDGYGIGIADAGDLDGDGRTELVIGAWQHGSGAPSGGRVYLYRADGSPLATYTSKVMGETFGFDATGLGDVDGDGNGDLLLTSAWAPVRGPRAGRVFIVAGPALPRN